MLRGRLTGRVLPVRGDDDVYVDLEVDLTEVVLGEALQGAPELTRLRLVAAPDRLPDAAQTVPALAGAEVVAFVDLRGDAGGQSDGPVGAPLPVEGLMTGCGDRLAGWVGTGDGWALGSLDEVVVAALGVPSEVVALQGPWVAVTGGEELEVFRGPEHCGQEAAMTALLFPSGRLFVRDPEGTFPPTTADLDTDAVAPAGLPELAWQQDDADGTLRAVLVAGQDALDVQLTDGGWERWPEVVPAVGCA